VKLRNRRGACYLVCFAQAPYQHARHYLGFAYPDDDLAGASTAILAEIALAQHTRPTRRKLTAFQATGVALRIARHRAGTGSNLLAVAGAAGSTFTITRIWTSVTEHHEKALKDLNDRISLCPQCTPGTKAGTVIIPKRYRRARPGRTRELAA
jgi:hypothetical protein